MSITQSRGFTLIELMVSVSVFAIVMLLAAGAYIQILGITRQAQGISTSANSVSFALEYMTREIRTGTRYSCSSIPGGMIDCVNGGNTFSVVDQNGAGVTFSRAVLANGNYAIMQGTSPLTDSSINITSLTFYAAGTRPYIVGSDIIPAHVTIIVSGTFSTKGATVPFTIETGASMRNLDL